MGGGGISSLLFAGFSKAAGTGEYQNKDSRTDAPCGLIQSGDPYVPCSFSSVWIQMFLLWGTLSLHLVPGPHPVHHRLAIGAGEELDETFLGIMQTEREEARRGLDARSTWIVCRQRQEFSPSPCQGHKKPK